MTGNQVLDLVIIALKAIVIVLVTFIMGPTLIVMERKLSAYIQDRPGPNRAHILGLRLWGFIYVAADAVKIFTKENFVPAHAHKVFFYLAPMITMAVVLTTGAILPFADNLVWEGVNIPMQVLPINAGILWMFAFASLGVYAVILAGWSSNNKYSLLGALRSTAMLISYEIPMGLAIIGLLMIYGTLDLNLMVQQQGGMLTFFGLFPLGVQLGPVALGIPNWGVFLQPIGFILFLVAMFAETNRTPFDLAEAEGELVAGFHTEYGGMKFGMFLFGEYMAMTVMSAAMATLFFGGWQVPFLDTEALKTLSLPLMRGALGGGAVVLLVFAGLAFQFYRNHLGRWKDMRDNEGLVMAILFAGLALLALGSMGLSFLIPSMPVWGGVAFAAVAQFLAFFTKVFLFGASYIWVRWTVPRFRYDQLMDLGWKYLLPLGLVNILLTGTVLLLLDWAHKV